jgi:hypothetical protein
MKWKEDHGKVKHGKHIMQENKKSGTSRQGKQEDWMEVMKEMNY